MALETIFDYLAVHLRERPDAPVYLHDGGALPFRDFQHKGAKLGGALKSFGIAPGDRVAMVMQDSPELAVSLLAITGIGGIAVPCNTALSHTDLTHVLSQSGARVVIISVEHVETLSLIRAHVPNVETVITTSEKKPAGFLSFAEFLDAGKPAALGAKEGPAFLVYTSGSTGRPKGALHYHSDIPFIIEAIGRKVYEITRLRFRKQFCIPDRVRCALHPPVRTPNAGRHRASLRGVSPDGFLRRSGRVQRHS